MSDPWAPFAAAVEAERVRTASQAAALQREFDEIVEGAELTSTDDEHDPDGSTIAYERAKAWALLRQARHDLAALDVALARAAAGTAGTCERCCGGIPLERLLALPHTRRCVGCAS